MIYFEIDFCPQGVFEIADKISRNTENWFEIVVQQGRIQSRVTKFREFAQRVD